MYNNTVATIERISKISDIEHGNYRLAQLNGRGWSVLVDPDKVKEQDTIVFIRPGSIVPYSNALYRGKVHYDIKKTAHSKKYYEIQSAYIPDTQHFYQGYVIPTADINCGVNLDEFAIGANVDDIANAISTRRSAAQNILTHDKVSVIDSNKYAGRCIPYAQDDPELLKDLTSTPLEIGIVPPGVPCTVTFINDVMTVYIPQGELPVQQNSIWYDAMDGLYMKLQKLNRDIAITGVICCKHVSTKNKTHELRVVCIDDIAQGQRLRTSNKLTICIGLGLRHIPIANSHKFHDQDPHFQRLIEDLKKAHGYPIDHLICSEIHKDNPRAVMIPGR